MSGPAFALLHVCPCDVYSLSESATRLLLWSFSQASLGLLLTPWTDQWGSLVTTRLLGQLTWLNDATCANVLQHFGSTPTICSITPCMASFSGGRLLHMHDCRTVLSPRKLASFPIFWLMMIKLSLIHSLPAWNDAFTDLKKKEKRLKRENPEFHTFNLVKPCRMSESEVSTYKIINSLFNSYFTAQLEPECDSDMMKSSKS